MAAAGSQPRGEAEPGSGESLARLPQAMHARREHNQYGEGSAGNNAQKVIQVERGRSSPKGRPAEIWEHQEVREVYLGEELSG